MKTFTDNRIFVVAIIIVLITVIGIGIGDWINQKKPTDAPVVTTPEPTPLTTTQPSETAEPSQSPDNPNSTTVPDNGNNSSAVNRFEGIGGLNYTILRNVFTPEGEVLFDIYTDAGFKDEQIILIGKKVHQIYSETNIVNQMNYNVFSDKGAYEKTTQSEYNKQPLQGLVSNFWAVADVVEYNRYIAFSQDESFEFDKANYVIESVAIEGSSAKAHVIIDSLVKEDIWDTAKGLTYIIKDLNKKLGFVTICFYSDQNHLKAGTPEWIFNGNYPEFVTKTSKFILKH